MIGRALRRPEAALFALVLGAYAYFYQAGGWNQNSRIDLVRAIVELRQSRIDPFAGNTGDLSRKAPLAAHARLGADGKAAYRRGRGALPSETYCDKAPGLSWLAVPPYAAIHAAAGGGPPTPARLAWSTWAATVFAVGVPSAIAAVLLALLLGAWGVRAGWACAAAAAWALATLAWPYGTLLYGHQTVAAALLIGFALVAIPVARGAPASRARLVVAGLVLGYGVVIEYPALLACLAIGGYVLANGGVRRAAWLALGAAPPALALVAYHAAVFGGPLAFPYDFSTQPHRSMGFFMGLGAPDPGALWHLTFGAYRGLFHATPWLVLAVPGAVVLARRGRAAEAIVCAAIFVLFLWLNASLVDWQGGWAMGARYLVPCVPFLALAAAGLLVPRPRGPLVPARGARFDGASADEPAAAPPRAPRRAPPWARRALVAGALVLVAASGANMLVGTAVKPEVPVQIRAPFSAYLYPRFVRGELSVSTQGIEMAGHPERGPRRAWNLGQRAGLDGLPSLAPLALWLLGWGAVIWRRSRARA